MHKLIFLPHAEATLEENGCATLSIVNAGVLNILSTPVIKDLTEAVAFCAQRPEIRVLVLRGEGSRAFVAGADISEMAGLNRRSAEAFIGGLAQLYEALRHFPTPVIARVSGWCLGGGMELALACDVRVSSDTAQYGMPEVKVGVPSVSHATLLHRLIGESRSAWMLLSGENIDANQALAWGLTTEVVSLDRIDQRIAEITDMFCGLGPAVLRQQKALLRRWEDLPLRASINNSLYEFGHAFDTGEPQRFMNTFLEEKKKQRSQA